MIYSRTEICCFLEALLFLCLARLLLRLLPFRCCLKLIGEPRVKCRLPRHGELTAVKQALRRADRRAFWNNVCLGQSMAARWMLRIRRIRSAVNIGVKSDLQTKIAAHAWVSSHDVDIVECPDGYQILFRA